MSDINERLSSLSSMESFSEDTCSSVEITDDIKTPLHVFCYEVLFKCVTGNFLSEEIFKEGDFVTVEGDRGYNVGVISKTVIDPSATLKILTKLNDSVDTIKSMLASKIVAENAALLRCREFCSGRRIGLYIDTLSAEFQFDRKKLTIYVKKSGEVSVCKLVRKLYDAFKMRISVEEISTVESIKEMIHNYLNVSQIGVPFSEVFVHQPIPNTYCPPQPAIIDKLPIQKNEDGLYLQNMIHNHNNHNHSSNNNNNHNNNQSNNNKRSSNLSSSSSTSTKLHLQKPALLNALHDYMPSNNNMNNNNNNSGNLIIHGISGNNNNNHININNMNNNINFENDNIYRYQPQNSISQYTNQSRDLQMGNNNNNNMLGNRQQSSRQPIYRPDNYLAPESNSYSSQYRYEIQQQQPLQSQHQSSISYGVRATRVDNNHNINDNNAIMNPSIPIYRGTRTTRQNYSNTNLPTSSNDLNYHPTNSHHLSSELDYSGEEYNKYNESYQSSSLLNRNNNNYDTDYYSQNTYDNDYIELNINSLNLSNNYDSKYHQQINNNNYHNVSSIHNSVTNQKPNRQYERDSFYTNITLSSTNQQQPIGSATTTTTVVPVSTPSSNQYPHYVVRYNSTEGNLSKSSYHSSSTISLSPSPTNTSPTNAENIFHQTNISDQYRRNNSGSPTSYNNHNQTSTQSSSLSLSSNYYSLQNNDHTNPFNTLSALTSGPSHFF